MAAKKLLFVVDTDWFFLSHRLSIALAAKKAGWHVTVVTTDTGEAQTIRDHGLGFCEAKLIRTKLNLVSEFRIFRRLLSIYQSEQPDLVHHVSLKIIVNGGVAAKIAGVPMVVNAVTGLGHYFINPRKAWVVNFLFSPVFRLIRTCNNLSYIFQNKDDQELFIAKKWAKPNQVRLIKGSGVDIEKFRYTEEPVSDPVKVLCGTRLLRDKGIVEFVEAARLVKAKLGNRVLFVLAGKIISENPTSIPESEINEWVSQGLVTYIGYQKDINSCLADSHINVLPSYREGLPKSLIEACAAGRPIITSDVPGCRDVVENGVNGFLVPVADSVKLADAIITLVIDKNLRVSMGYASRQKAILEFALDKVVDQTMSIYRDMEECVRSKGI